MTGIAVSIVVLLCVIQLAACGNDPVRPVTEPVTQPVTEPEIDNAIDSFRFQATGVTNFSTPLAYTWRNTGFSASVDQFSAIAAGTAMLIIEDANGARVYSRSLGEQGTFGTIGRGGAGNCCACPPACRELAQDSCRQRCQAAFRHRSSSRVR